jgi:hypothetical protein
LQIKGEVPSAESWLASDKLPGFCGFSRRFWWGCSTRIPLFSSSVGGKTSRRSIEIKEIDYTKGALFLIDD